MISERQLSVGFDSFWNHHFPLLNPSFVRRFNAEKKERLISSDGTPLLPIPMGKEVERFDVVAEVAFEFSQDRFIKGEGDFVDLNAASERAIARMSAIREETLSKELSAAELQEVEALSEVYNAFFKSMGPRVDLTFRPRVMGAGILDESEADFCSASSIFEVKAVNRNIQSVDLRQVLCYLISGIGSGKYSWSDYCIFNPRLAVVYTGNVADLLMYLSGKTPSECIADMLDSLMEREQPLESRF